MSTEELKLCRICLGKSACISIFTVSAAPVLAENEEPILYSEQIMRCTRIQLTEYDGLPADMCATCEAELAVSYRFLLKCETSDVVLRKLANSETPFSISEPASVKNEVLSDIDDFSLMKEEYLESDANSNTEIVDKERKRGRPRRFKVENVKEENLEINIIAAESDIHLKIKKKIGRPRKFDVKVVKKENIKLKFKNEKEEETPKEKRKRGRPRKDPNMLQPKYIPKLYKIRQKVCKSCPVCGLLVYSPSAMIIHLRVHSDEKPFACDQCSRAFKAKGTLKRHIEVHHKPRERKYICEHCGGRFYRKRDVVIHMRRHTGEKPHACPFCPMRFLQIGSMIRHKRTHTGEKPYSCEICSKSFADKSMVSKHMIVHSDERKYSCHLCGKPMKTIGALNNHVRLHSNEKSFVCTVCGMAFAMKGNLTAHMGKVHSQLSGQCEVCHKAVSNLKQHMNKHTGELPYECDKCMRAFASKRSLGNHQKFRHGNVNKYKCTKDDCDRSFPTPSMLTFHMLKYHTNHTPYICKLCLKGFFRVSDLSRHLRVSHNQVCDKPEDFKKESTG